MDIFVSEDTNHDNREEDIDEESEENINLPITDFYSHAVVIIHICY